MQNIPEGSEDTARAQPVRSPSQSTALPISDEKPEAIPRPEPKQPGPSTLAAYEKDLRLFRAAGGRIPCDPALLLTYLSKMGKICAPTTLHRRLMAIRWAHVSEGLSSPTDDTSIKTIMRALQLGYLPGSDAKAAPTRSNPIKKCPEPAKPISRATLSKMLDAMHRSTLDYRDRAMLLLGFCAALSRAQLVALNVSDLRFTPDAMIVRVRRNGESRQAGDGVATTGESRQVSVPVTGGELCAATACRAWIAHAALDANPAAPKVPLFCRFDRSGDPTPNRLDSAYVSMVLKRRLREVGIDPSRYSAHSLKRGRLAELARGTL